MSDKFNIGDVVQLKSGGEKMTIEEIENEEDISCVWFEGSQTRRSSFIAATLQRCEPETGSISINRV